MWMDGGIPGNLEMNACGMDFSCSKVINKSARAQSFASLDLIPGANLGGNTVMTPIRSITTNAIRTALIAPCGMNCRLCRAYMREKRACPGCRGDDSVKSKACVMCRIKNCEKMARGGFRYCFSCESYPCGRLNQLDKRYRAKYGMSMIDNLENIRKSGMRHFIRNEKARWTCPECGEIICVHKPQCLFCKHKWN